MPSLIKLESLAGDSPVEILQLETGSLTIGRAEDNGVVIDTDSVSRNHVCLFEVMDYWFLEDLNSTNGTMVNGVKLNPGQLRLLRDDDLIQLASFPVRFSEVEKRHLHEIPPPPSLLIFSGNNFETDFPLTTPDSRFIAGGDEAHLFIPDLNPKDSYGQDSYGQNTGSTESNTTEPLFQILAKEMGSKGTSLELVTSGARRPPNLSIVVNGMAISGVTALRDRDEIDVAGYKIIVNDLKSAQSSKQSKLAAATGQPANKPGGIAIQAHIGSGTDPLSKRWEVDPMKKKLATNRNFVFGTAPDESDDDPVTGTISMSRSEMARKVGEVGISKRGGQSMNYASDQDPEKAEQKQMIIGIISLLILIAAGAYFFLAM